MITKPYYTNGQQTIYLGDCKELLKEIPKNSIHCILTDPPYLVEFQWCWKKLGFHGQRVLKKKGSLFTLLGVMNLPKAMIGLGQYGLNFWWCCGMFHNVPFPYRASVQCRWKPALWFVKGDEKPNITHWPCDLMAATREKTLHDWQQPIGWIRYWLSHLSKEGDTVLDPFMGAGTTLIAAKYLNRKCIGFEIEEKSAEKAAKRLERTTTLGIVIESITPLGLGIEINQEQTAKRNKK